MHHQSSDWLEWHNPYKQKDSSLSRRLAIIQSKLKEALPLQVEKHLQIISLCAGQGHDVLDVLADYSDASKVNARLVELDERNVIEAQRWIEAKGLNGVEVIQGDAALLSIYQGVVPADIVLVCGVFGNISNEDIFRTIDSLPQLCKKGATVIWTRSRRKPDITPAIRHYFIEHGFQELDFVGPSDDLFGVGVNRFTNDPQSLEPMGKLFTFIV